MRSFSMRGTKTPQNRHIRLFSSECHYPSSRKYSLLILRNIYFYILTFLEIKKPFKINDYIQCDSIFFFLKNYLNHCGMW